MPLDPEGIVEFEAGGESHRLYFGMRAVKATELHYDKPFGLAIKDAMPALKPEDLGDPEKVAAAGAQVRLTEVLRLFRFALLKYEPDTSEEDVEDLVDSIGLSKTTELLGQAIAAAMSEEGAGDEAAADPRKAGRRSTTGSRS